MPQVTHTLHLQDTSSSYAAAGTAALARGARSSQPWKRLAHDVQAVRTICHLYSSRKVAQGVVAAAAGVVVVVFRSLIVSLP